MHRDPAIGSDSLSPREREIALLGADGLSDKLIAAKLGISLPTVRSYWVRIRNKTGVHGRAEAAAIVVRSEDEAAHLKLVNELRQQLHFDGLRFAALAELLHCLIWVTDSEFVVRARYGPEPTGFEWAGDIRVGAALADAFRRSGRGKTVADAHRQAMGGGPSSITLSGAVGEVKVLIGPSNDESGLIVGCVGVMQFGMASMRGRF